jgi:hypothetical protein
MTADFLKSGTAFVSTGDLWPRFTAYAAMSKRCGIGKHSSKDTDQLPSGFVSWSISSMLNGNFLKKSIMTFASPPGKYTCRWLSF